MFILRSSNDQQLGERGQKLMLIWFYESSESFIRLLFQHNKENPLRMVEMPPAHPSPLPPPSSQLRYAAIVMYQ